MQVDAGGFGHTFSFFDEPVQKMSEAVESGFVGKVRRMGEANIATAIHYPVPLHRQQPYQHFPIALGGAPVSERLADEVISLPMHAYLDEAAQERIIAAVRGALAT